MVTVVLPEMDPAFGVTLETTGTVGDQSQLSTVMLVPQYVSHCPALGALPPGG
jgi:hypothetical protein